MGLKPACRASRFALHQAPSSRWPGIVSSGLSPSLTGINTQSASGEPASKSFSRQTGIPVPDEAIGALSLRQTLPRTNKKFPERGPVGHLFGNFDPQSGTEFEVSCGDRGADPLILSLSSALPPLELRSLRGTTSSCRRWSSWRPSEQPSWRRQPSGPSEPSGQRPSWSRPRLP